MAKWIAEGWHSVTPQLVVHDVAKLIEFLQMEEFAVRDRDGYVLGFGQPL
jgi:hypothetical protein